MYRRRSGRPERKSLGQVLSPSDRHACGGNVRTDRRLWHPSTVGNGRRSVRRRHADLSQRRGNAERRSDVGAADEGRSLVARCGSTPGKRAPLAPPRAGATSRRARCERRRVRWSVDTAGSAPVVHGDELTTVPRGPRNASSAGAGAARRIRGTALRAQVGPRQHEDLRHSTAQRRPRMDLRRRA
jgi:hypothetical protein